MRNDKVFIENLENRIMRLRRKIGTSKRQIANLEKDIETWEKHIRDCERHINIAKARIANIPPTPAAMKRNEQIKALNGFLHQQ